MKFSIATEEQRAVLARLAQIQATQKGLDASLDKCRNECARLGMCGKEYEYGNLEISVGTGRQAEFAGASYEQDYPAETQEAKEAQAQEAVAKIMGTPINVTTARKFKLPNISAFIHEAAATVKLTFSERKD